MRLASLATVSAALVVSVTAAAGSPIWSAPATIDTCAPATNPKVVFPTSWPSQRSGRGAILWLGGAPHCGRSGSSTGTTLDVASLHSDDLPSIPRSFVAGSGLGGPLGTAWT